MDYCKTLSMHLNFTIFIHRKFVAFLFDVLFRYPDSMQIKLWQWANFRNSHVFNLSILVKLRKFNACEI